MKNEERIDFDLSSLNLSELIESYQDIEDFIHFLEEQRIEEDDLDE